MASSTLAFLLNLPPEQAIVRMLNDANGTNYRLDRFTVSAPRLVAGTTTTVTLTSTDISPYLDDQVTVGSLDFTYERLELVIFLKGVLDSYTPSLPCSTQTLLNEITHRIDQRFYGDDILLEELTRDNGVQYVLKAKPESLRFVGSITLPLIQVTDIGSLFNANLIIGDIGNGPVYPNLDDAVAYVTGTDILNQNTTIGAGEVVQANSVILQVIGQQVPDPATGLYNAPWYADSATPGPYNLYGSKVVYRGSIQDPGSIITYVDPATGQNLDYTFPELCNTAMPALDKVVIVAIHSGYCLNARGTLTIPYSSVNFNYTPAQLLADKAANPTQPDSWFALPGDGFVAKPRLIHNSVVSISDGSQWNSYLNALAPQVILSFQNTPPITMDGPVAWAATYGSLVYTNLYNASIVYNGQVRAGDLPAATVGLDRVMVVDFTGSSNSQWDGQYGFYYKSPVEISGTSFSSTLGGQTRIPLLATGTGISVVEVNGDGSVLTTTNIPAGLVLTTDNGEWVISGTPTAEGSFTYFLHAISGGDTVFYTISHLVRKAIAGLQLTGTLTPAIEGDATWQSYLNIEGGQAPYTLGAIVGDLPTSVTAVIQYDTVHLTGSWNDIAVHHFNITVTSADGQSTSSSYTMQASGTTLAVSASSSFSATLYMNASFSGNFTVIGGQAPYSYTVSSGAFPPGLLLNGGTGQVTGSPTASGTYTFTVTVVSNDSFVGSVTVTATVSSLTYAQAVIADTPNGYWPCDDAPGTVLREASGLGTNGSIISDPAIIFRAAPLRPGSIGSLQLTSKFTSTASLPLNAMYSATSWTLELIAQLDAGNIGELATNGSFLQGAWYGMGIIGNGSWAVTSDGTFSSINRVQSSASVSAAPAHVMMEKDNAVLNMYVNGVLVGTNTPGAWGTWGYIRFFGGSDTAHASTGRASDVAIYAYALGPAKAKLHAQLAGLYTGV